MNFDEHAILTGLDHKGQSNRKLQLAKLTAMHTADENTRDNEDASCVSHRAGNEKFKQKKSKEALLSEGMQIYRTDQPESKEVFLPRLTGSSERASPDNKSQDEKCHQLRLPEIRIVPTNNSMLALNRSITDLLDPEMEILNKIKYGPRKKRKKRRNKTVQRCESYLP